MVEARWARLASAAWIVAAWVALAPVALERAVAPSAPLDHERIRAVRDVLTRAVGEAGDAGAEAGSKGRGVPRVPQYRISMALMVDGAARGPVGWSVDEAIDKSLRPLLDALAPLATVQVGTQTLYFSRLAKDAAEGEVTLADLRGFMGANDWDAGASSASERQVTLHLMAYLPGVATRVVGPEGPSDSFLVPRWGGVHVLPYLAHNQSWLGAGQLEPTMRVFGAQLQELLGVHLDAAGAVPEASKREWLVHYLSGASSGLQALSELVESASEMVVLDRVSALVRDALAEIEEVLADRKAGCLAVPSDSCLSRARRAFEAAESAFFDPTLLPQLYYPPEHWIAVYMPFLLPTLLPVVAGTMATVREIVRPNK